jgi:hypothetical protein
MSLLTLEGFEKYSSLNDIKSYLNYETYQVPTIISASDGVVTPRDSLSSLKLLSTIGSGSYGYPVYYPKFGIKNLANHTNGIVGFAYYAYAPNGGSYSPTTPIAAICDPTGKPHFFICINGSMQVEIRRWNSGASLGTSNTVTGATYTWNADLTGTSIAYDNNYCQQATGYNHHLSTPTTVGQSCLTKNVSYWSMGINTTALPVIFTVSGANVLEINAWNYIEVEYNVSSTATGGFNIRINRNSNSNVIDGTVSNLQTTTQPTNNVGQVAFGAFWAHNTAGNAFGSTTNTAGWPSYFDDIYILNKDAIAPNDFLGSISCRKGGFDTQVSNTAFSGDLSSINDAVFSGVANLSNKLVLSSVGQQITVKATNLPIVSTNTIRLVQPVVYGYSTGGSLKSKTILGGNESANTEMILSSDSVSGGVTFGPTLSTDPQGNNWTEANLKNTDFRFGT